MNCTQRPSLSACLLLTSLLVGSSWVRAQNTATKILVGKTRVTVIAGYTGNDKLPAPQQIVIHDFDVPSEIITIDDSHAARLHSNGLIAHMKGDTGQDQDPAIVAEKVQAAFSKTLLSDLGKSTIPITRSPLGANPDASAGTLIIRGSFTTVNQGNRGKRIVIGLGRGASDVQAHVNISLLTADGPILLSEFNVDSSSGKKPGAAETMGIGGAAASVAANGAEDSKATVEGDTARMAHAVAKELKAIMTAQKWIPGPDSGNAAETSGTKQPQ